MCTECSTKTIIFLMISIQEGVTLSMCDPFSLRLAYTSLEDEESLGVEGTCGEGF